MADSATPTTLTGREGSGYYNFADASGGLATVFGDIDALSLSDEVKDRIKDQVAEQYYKQGPDLDTFEKMLKKLTGSKMQQKGQELAARRGDIYAGGLANMMSNF